MIRKYQDFVEKLQSSTNERKITWEKASGQNEYQVAIGANSVSIKYHPASDFPIAGDDNIEYVSLLIWNSQGENIDEVRANAGSFDYSSLHGLYESARRASMKVEETLDEMLASLEK